jgi:uncharacterized protein YndB with AHSA1/START domain
MSGTDSVLVSEIIPASRERIYAAWLDSRQHSAFTGEEATIEPTVGGKHSAFGGYASGRNLELEPHRRIVQTWRSAEFPDGSPDSRVEVTLEETGGGTLVTLLHTDIPQGQADRYRESWLKFYLEPLKRFFTKPVTNGVNGTSNGHHTEDLLKEASAELEELLAAADAKRARTKGKPQPNGVHPTPKGKGKGKSKLAAKPAARTKTKPPAKTAPAKAKAKAKAPARPKAKAPAKAKAKAKVPAKAKAKTKPKQGAKSGRKPTAAKKPRRR